MRRANLPSSFSGSLDLMTYFNGFSCSKWGKYTGLDRAYLHVELAGDACDIEMMGVSLDAAKSLPMTPLTDPEPLDHTLEPSETGISSHFAGSDAFTPIELEFTFDTWAVVGPILRSVGRDSDTQCVLVCTGGCRCDSICSSRACYNDV